jgi:hypothetical protein
LLFITDPYDYGVSGLVVKIVTLFEVIGLF